MYTTGSGNPRTVTALDARTGRQIWRYTRPQKVTQPVRDQPVQPRRRDPRQPAVRRHARRRARSALDARTGLPLWEVQVADTMEGYSITSPPLVVKDKVIVGIAGGEFATARIPRRLRRGDRQAAVALLHDSRPGRVRQRHLEGRQLEDRRRRDVADRHLRSRARTRVYWPVGNPAPQIDRSVRGDGDNLFTRFGRRARSRHRPAQVALPVHAERRARLGLDRGHDARRSRVARPARASCCCTPTATGTSTCSIAPTARSSRARRSSTRTGTPASTRRAGRCRARIELEPRRQLPRLPDARRRHEFPGAVVQPAHRLVLSRVRRGRPAVRERAAGARDGAAQYLGAARRTRRRPRAARTSRRRTPASRRSIRRPARRCGTSSCSRDRSPTACWRRRAACCSPRRATATSSRSTRRPGKHLWHFQTGGNHAASPISYAVDGRQYVALSAGNVLFSFALPE